MRNLRKPKAQTVWVRPEEIGQLKYQIIMNQSTIFVIEKFLRLRKERGSP